MTCFVDTSALLSVLDQADDSHNRSASEWRRLVDSGEELMTTSYVLVELFALTQSRLGIDAIRTLNRVVVPLLDVRWVDAEIHNRAMAALLITSRRRLSLVDCVSFETMRSFGIRECFTLDKHFSEFGFVRRP